jgi:VanZ family protein
MPSRIEETPTLTLMKHWLWRWGPALALMALIFAASSQPKAVVPDLGVYDWSVKKGGHVLIYAGLALTYLHALSGGHPRAATWRQAAAAVALATLYGATDEYHQSFVAGRGATAVDVVIDMVGALAGAAATRIRARPARLRSTR